VSTLHIVSVSPFSASQALGFLSLWQEGDEVLFMEDGVYVLQHQSLATLPDSACYFLQEDVQARALAAGQAACVDYAGFVELVCRHQNSVNWSR
jgi:tRNA 2-thiouridine synthesizing protein B